jgi:hypothetical protein
MITEEELAIWFSTDCCAEIVPGIRCPDEDASADDCVLCKTGALILWLDSKGVRVLDTGGDVPPVAMAQNKVFALVSRLPGVER